MKIILSALLCLSLLLLIVTPVSANPINESSKSSEQSESEAIKQISEITGQSEDQVKKDLETASLLQEFFSKTEDGYVVFDKVAALNAGVVNEDIILGIDNDFKNIKEYVSNQSLQRATSSCNGENDWGQGILSEEVKIDSCGTNQILGALAVTASVATIAGIIATVVFPPVALGFAAAAALTGFAAGVVTIAGAYGCGVKVKHWYGLPWSITSQC